MILIGKKKKMAANLSQLFFIIVDLPWKNILIKVTANTTCKISKLRLRNQLNIVKNTQKNPFSHLESSWGKLFLPVRLCC